MARILLVEDDEMNRDMLSRRLRRRGYDVIIALDGGQAIGMVESDSPDLVLMDFDLPVLSGTEATERIRAGASGRLPIISLTAHAMLGDDERAMKAGCDDYVTKPIDFPLLIGKIERLLGEIS